MTVNRATSRLARHTEDSRPRPSERLLCFAYRPCIDVKFFLHTGGVSELPAVNCQRPLFGTSYFIPTMTGHPLRKFLTPGFLKQGIYG